MRNGRPLLQLFSDLHLEFLLTEQARRLLEARFPRADGASAIILAGDIGVPTGRRRRSFELALEFFSSRYPSVLFVPGNHEFYGTRAADGLEKIRKIVRRHPKVTLLEPGVVARWGDRRVVGATLWFRESPGHPRLAGMLSDFSAITEFVPWVYEQNRAHAAWLDETVREGDVVVTHHLPAPGSVAPQYVGDPLNTFFLCDLTPLIEERRPWLWVHGHTHTSRQYKVGATTVLANPLGYPGEENPAFDAGLWSE
jgi:Icc-related predicted phosphoesterase